MKDITQCRTVFTALGLPENIVQVVMGCLSRDGSSRPQPAHLKETFGVAQNALFVRAVKLNVRLLADCLAAGRERGTLGRDYVLVQRGIDYQLLTTTFFTSLAEAVQERILLDEEQLLQFLKSRTCEFPVPTPLDTTSAPETVCRSVNFPLARGLVTS